MTQKIMTQELEPIKSKEPEVQLLKEIDKALTMEIASRHSYFQLKYFVVNSEPTNQARMWQCLRELKTRRDSLAAIELEIAENQDNIELTEIKVKKKEREPILILGTDESLKELSQKENQIQIRKLKRKIAALIENATNLLEKKKWIEQEARFFLESFRNLEKVEPLKHFDDLESQKQYWGEKLSNKLNLKSLLQSPLDTELVDTILCLPDDIPVKKAMVSRLESVQKQLLALKEQFKHQLNEGKKQ